jgi:O-methyltransferase involved in polyketide biosynthesis
VASENEPVAPPGINARVPSPARVYDYWLGGQDNFAADREAAEAFIKVFPGIITGVRMNRAFLGRAVAYAVAEGVRQFLDIGTGLPTADNTHEVAQRLAPESRVVYVDNDPVVLLHATSLMTSTPEGACDYLQADLREPEKILEGAARTLDFSRPVAVSLLQILQFIPDEADPWRLIRAIMEPLPSGSYLIVSQPTLDVMGDTISDASDTYNSHLPDNQTTVRTRAEILRFFDGLELVEPGLVELQQWRPDPGVEPAKDQMPALAGVGRKP